MIPLMDAERWDVRGWFGGRADCSLLRVVSRKRGVHGVLEGPMWG